MRILVANAFRPDGVPDLGQALEGALRDRGHEVEAIRIPFDPDPEVLWPQLLGFRLTDISDVGELLVATATPCHVLRHPRKVLWLTEYYPWLNAGSDAFHPLQTVDRQACGEATAVFAVSQLLCDSLARSSGHAVKALPPPREESWDSVVGALTGQADRPTIQ